MKYIVKNRNLGIYDRLAAGTNTRLVGVSPIPSSWRFYHLSAEGNTKEELVANATVTIDEQPTSSKHIRPLSLMKQEFPGVYKRVQKILEELVGQ